MTKYKTLVIDPPWKISPFRFRAGGYAKALPYDTMTDHEITQFPLDDYAAPESLLFLWATQSKLRTAFQILLAWRFKPFSTITWAKTTGPTAHGVHFNTEFALFGYRGKMLTDRHNPLSMLIQEKARQHSRKPDRFYDMLRRCTPEPRIDIFARYRHQGFDAYGDQVLPATQKTLL